MAAASKIDFPVNVAIDRTNKVADCFGRDFNTFEKFKIDPSDADVPRTIHYRSDVDAYGRWPHAQICGAFLRLEMP